MSAIMGRFIKQELKKIIEKFQWEGNFYSLSDKQTDRQTDRQTYRQTDRQTRMQDYI